MPQGSVPRDGVPASDLDALFKTLEDLFARWDQRKRAMERGRAAEEELALATQELEEAEELCRSSRLESRRAQDALRAVEGAFSAWLEETGLPRGLGPGDVPRVIETISRCRDAALSIHRLSRHIERLRGEREGFEREARGLLGALSMEMDVLPGVEYARELLGKAKALNERSRRLQWKRDQHAAEIRKRWAVARELFQGFSGRGEEEPFWKGLEGLLCEHACDGGLPALKGGEGPLPQGLDGMRSRVEEKRARLARRQRELLSQRAELVHARKVLCSSDELMELRRREEDLRNRLSALAERWATHSVASYLLEEAKRRFEEEHQPRVLRDAGGYFKAVTRGRYVKVTAPVDGGVRVINNRGEPVDPARLSRGTVEQLYLCLRLAYISNYSSRGEGIPVVMDDVLVNFDPARAGEAGGVISAFAGNRQVLFFTCHPHVVRIFRDHGRVAGLFRIKGGEIVPWTC